MAEGALSSPPLPEDTEGEDVEDPDAWSSDDREPALDPELARQLLTADGKARSAADDQRPRRNERFGPTGAFFAASSNVLGSRAPRFGATNSLGARIGVRFFPTREGWSAAGMIEAASGSTGFELGIPLRLEANYIPDAALAKVPSLRIGALAHPFWSFSTGPGTSSTRHGVRGGLLFGWSVPVALSSQGTNMLLGLAGIGVLIVTLALPALGPIGALALTAVGLLLAMPEFAIGIEVGQDSLMGSYYGSFFSLGFGM